jgi:DNA (cytosine-5)-methyltransferase 1
MQVLDLFSGIGGFSLGLERAGMSTVAFCEVDKKAQLVLKKHWPSIPIFDDVKTLNKEKLNERSITVDVICGGFPCQDLSVAGTGKGLEGSRSGLWFEYGRIISELRPRYVIVENVSALLNRGLDQVLGQLAQIGYDAEWHCIPASAVGAPHRRDRIWIVAYPTSVRFKGLHYGYSETENVNSSSTHTNFQRLERQRTISSRIGSELCDTRNNSWWEVEPDVGRVAHGVSNRVDRLKQLGNSIVPQIAEIIGRAIMDDRKPS